MITATEKTLMLQIGGLATSGLYSFQDARLGQNNRTRNLVFRKVTGLDYRDLQEKKDKTSKKIMKDFKDKKIAEHIQDLHDKGDIDAQEYQFILRVQALAKEAEVREKAYEKIVADYVKGEDVWKLYLDYIHGIGTKLTAALLYYFGYCERAEHISSMWKFAGLTPDSKHKKGESSSFNTRLRMFMIGRLGSCLIKCANERYKPIYDAYKKKELLKLEHGKQHAPKNTGHAHAKAIRYMVKEFLKDYFLWCAKYTGRDTETKWITDPRYGAHDRDDREDIFEFIERVKLAKEK